MIIKGKWALVTGSSRGIGKIIASDLAAKGCKVILHSRKLDGTSSLLNELISKGFECYSVAAE